MQPPGGANAWEQMPMLSYEYMIKVCLLIVVTARA